MFDEYVELITDEIKTLDESLNNFKDELLENFKDEDIKEKFEDSNSSLELMTTDDNEIEENQLIEIDLLVVQLENINTNLNTLIEQNDEIVNSIAATNKSNIEGFWVIFISIIISLGLKIFFDNLLKW